MLPLRSKLRTCSSEPTTTWVATGLAIALAMPLHWVFLGIAARRLGRSVAGWVGLSVLLFPVGSAAALILLAWGLTEPGPDAHAAAR